MARTFDSQRLRHQRSMDRRLLSEHRRLARQIGALVIGAASARSPAGERIVPNTRRGRDRLKRAIWSQALKPYYIGPGDDAFREAEAQSPYARLLYDGIAGAIRIQVERQAALLNRLVKDEAVLQWLTGPRPPAPVSEQRGVYDPFHTWVDPNGYRLSDRVWRTSIAVRTRIDQLLDYHIAQGTSAVRIAELLEDYLTRGARLIRTHTPYGREGSYAARRLARTEITAAAGRATVNASLANPYVAGIRWRLSASHPRIDICDELARGGPNRDGIYAPDAVPTYPPHPHCLCSLVPVTVGNAAGVTAGLRAEIQANSSLARALQGLFNPIWLAQAILLGLVDEAVAQVEAALTGGGEPARRSLGSFLQRLGLPV